MEDTHRPACSWVPLQWAAAWWRNGRDREAEWIMCCGERQTCRSRSEGGEEEAGMGGLCRSPGSWWRRARSGSLVLTQRGSSVLMMSTAPVATQGLLEAQGMDCHLRPCCCRGWGAVYTDMSTIHPGPWRHPGQSCCQRPWLGLWSCCGWGLCYHQGPMRTTCVEIQGLC